MAYYDMISIDLFRYLYYYNIIENTIVALLPSAADDRAVAHNDDVHKQLTADYDVSRLLRITVEH